MQLKAVLPPHHHLNRLLSSLSPFHTLRARLGWVIFAIAIVLALLTSFAINQIASRQLEISTGTALTQLAHQVSDKLDRGMFERYRDIQVLTTLDVIQNPSIPVAQKRSLLEELQRSYPLYSWIGLTDPRGNVIASTRGLLENQTVAQRPWFQNTKTRPYVGDVHEAALLAKLLPQSADGEPLRFVDVSAPVFTAQKQFAGVLGAHLSWSWASEVRDSLLQPPERQAQIEAFIFNSEGKLLLGSADVQPQSFLSQSTESSYRIERWSDGKTYLTGIARSKGYLNYPGLNWIIVARQPTKAAFAPIVQLQHRILTLDLGLAAIAAIVGWRMAHHLTRPLLSISMAADQLRQGKLARLPLIQGRDEVARLSRSLIYLVQTLTEKEQALQIELTERQHAEATLRDSEERLRLALTAANQGLFDLNLQTGVVTVNESYARMLGYDPATFHETFETWRERLYPGDWEQVDRVFQEYVAGDRSEYRTEFRQRTAAGEWKWILSLGEVVAWDAERNPLRILGTHTDIDDRKQAEEQLRQLNQTLEQRVAQRTAQLEETNQELEAFTYSVSHDLRAPLRTIQGFAQALIEDYGGQLDDTGKGYIVSIVEDAVQMNNLIADLLAYSRLSRTQVRPQTVALHEAIAAALKQLSAQIREKQASITVPDFLPSVLAHRSILVQVLANLFSNAMKFVEPGIQPKVNVYTKIDKRSSETWVKLFIEDNGVGIAPEHQKRIFRVFERLHGVEIYPGTGIGLAIVQKGLERMGGEAGIKSELGQGSQFWIMLPASAPGDWEAHEETNSDTTN